MIWFTADTHFGHKNIIKYANRPFDSIDEMDKTIINNWNNCVDENDKVYHLGDVALCSPNKLRKILDQLNGKIYLIKGNHEKSALECKDRFEWVKDYHELMLNDPDGFKGKKLIVLFHYAMRVWNASHHGSLSLYGHTHGELEDEPKLLSIDVGVDCHDFKPINYNDVKNIMSKKKWAPPKLRNASS